MVGSPFISRTGSASCGISYRLSSSYQMLQQWTRLFRKYEWSGSPWLIRALFTYIFFPGRTKSHKLPWLHSDSLGGAYFGRYSDACSWLLNLRLFPSRLCHIAYCKLWFRCWCSLTLWRRDAKWRRAVVSFNVWRGKTVGLYLERIYLCFCPGWTCMTLTGWSGSSVVSNVLWCFFLSTSSSSYARLTICPMVFTSVCSSASTCSSG